MSKYELHLGMSKLSLTEILKHEMTFKFKEIIRLFVYLYIPHFFLKTYEVAYNQDHI